MNNIDSSIAFLPYSKPEDLTDPTKYLPLDVTSLICSKLELRNVINLAGMNRQWRSGVTKYCSIKISQIFGNIFDFTKRSPVQFFVDLWGPIKLRSNQLATVLSIDINLPFTKVLEAVFDAIERKSVEELKEKIKAVYPPDVLTKLKFGRRGRWGPPENPLRLAVESGEIEKVRCLIEIGTHVGLAIEEYRYNGPLLTAVVNRQEDILRLLLEYGASFSVTADWYISDLITNVTPSEPIPLLYLMLKRVSLEENDEVGLRCVALALRSWRDEKGSEAIQNDPWLEKFADYIIDSSKYQIVQLLMSYGVLAPKTETINKAKLNRGIEISVANARRGFLEFWNKKGLLNYQEYRNGHGFSLADLAVRYGQFELEKYLLEEKKVLHCKRDEALQGLKGNFSDRMIFLDKKGVITIGGMDSNQKCNVERLLEIFRHYKIDLDKDCLFKEATPLFHLCFNLKSYSRSTNNQELQENLPKALATLKLIEGIILLGAKLDLKSKFENKVQSPRDLLNEFLKYDEILRVSFEVNLGVEMILQRFPEVKDDCSFQ